MQGTKLLLLATVAPAHALLAAAPAIRSVARAPVGRMDDWRPTNVDPLGQAMGMPREIERPYSYWLDLRTSEITFAQMVVYKLFYAVRRVVDEAGKARARIERHVLSQEQQGEYRHGEEGAASPDSAPYSV